MVAVRQVTLPGVGVLGAERLNGIAVSPDAQRIWLSISGASRRVSWPGGRGRRVAGLRARGRPVTRRPPRRIHGTACRLPGACAGSVGSRCFPRAARLPTAGPSRAPPAAGQADAGGAGRGRLRRRFTPEHGLGPLFNDTSCVACHGVPTTGGMGPDGLAWTRVGRHRRRLRPHGGAGGPVAARPSSPSWARPARLRPGVPVGANMTSVRNAPALFGEGLIDALPDEAILAGARIAATGSTGGPTGSGAAGGSAWAASAGRPTPPRCGSSSPTPSATSWASPTPWPPDLPPRGATPAPPPAPSSTTTARWSSGHRLRGGAAAHRPRPSSRPGRAGRPSSPPPAAPPVTRRACRGDQEVPLYSDLLLHDVGSDLDDKVEQGEAEAKTGERRRSGVSARDSASCTTAGREPCRPLSWPTAARRTVAARYRALPEADREALQAFLNSL